MKQHILLVILLLALGLSACAGAAPAPNFAEPAQSAPSGGAPAEPAAPVSADAPGLDSAKATEGEAIARDQAQQEGIQRLVIKTAALMLEVENVRDAENAIRAKVAELNGYIVTAQSTGTDEDTYIDLVFRVPSDKFDTALSGVQGLATKVLSRGLGGEDVTEEFVDLDSRLRNLEATRDRLLDLLTKAEKVEDALAVNQALTDVQGQIEQIKGRMKYLQQSAAMATISVSLRPVPPEPTIVEEDSWQPVRVFRSALRDLVEFGQGLANLGIVLLVWSPLWLVIFLVGRWGWKKLTGGRKPKAPSDPTPPAPTPTPPAGTE